MLGVPPSERVDERTPRGVRVGDLSLEVADDEGSFWDRVEAGTWEPETLSLLASRLRPSVTFLDLGAWVGPLSLYAAALDARVVAVEADPAALADLRANVAANPGLADRIEIVAAAVAPAPGTVRLGARRKPGDSMSSVLLADSATSWNAPAVTPSDLAARSGDGPLFVKIDIEGAEYELLPHLGPLLARRPLACLIAFHPGLLRPDERDARTQAARAVFEGFTASPIGPDLWLFEAV